ncbi:hypothetical protein FJZ26_05695 [Candidatus Parvarchaeota archaeon]|nr:hypothetical protein [Candidatus Parvarchaeota archaeon]
MPNDYGAVIVRRAKQTEDGNELVQLCKYLRILSERDTDRTVTHVVKVLVSHGRQPIGSTELSKVSGLNRITCIHHLKRLLDAGVVEKKESQYIFAFGNFEEFVEQARREMLENFRQMDQLAKRIDEEFNLIEGFGEHGYGQIEKAKGRGEKQARATKANRTVAKKR